MSKFNYEIVVYDNTNENNRKGMWYTRIFDLDKSRYYDVVSRIMSVLAHTGDEKQDWDFEISKPLSEKVTFTLWVLDTESGEQLSRKIHHVLEGVRIGI